MSITRLQVTGNFVDVKPVGDDVFEMRFDYGPGYRVYNAHRGEEIVLLLIGDDKSKQQADIDKVKKINAESE